MHTREFVRTTASRCIAEIGIGDGDTSLIFAEHTAGGGEVHLFDFAARVDRVMARLAAAGHTHIVGHPNTDKRFDSYAWTLGRLLQSDTPPRFDYVYIDGAHTWFHDALAFVLVDRLLVPGGYVDFDDYGWTMLRSPTSNPWTRPGNRDLYTTAQMATAQVAMIVDLLVKPDPRYEMVVPDRIFRKRSPNGAESRVDPSPTRRRRPGGGQ